MKRFLTIFSLVLMVTLVTCQQNDNDSVLDQHLYELHIQWLDTASCVSPGVNKYVADDLCRLRIEALPLVVPVEYNQVVKNYIEQYLCDPKRLAKIKGLSQFYFPIFEEALLRHGLPVELKYMPIVESSLNPRLRSSAGAAGLWQFMPIAAKAYRLEVNSLVDERLDTYKSTEAACQLFEDLYQLYGDWSLVIAAYNCGPGTIRKAIARSGGKRDFWSLYPYLPPATRVYIPMFTAFAYIMEYGDLHGICPAPIEQPLLIDTVQLNQRTTFQQVSNKTGTTISQLRVLNPQYLQDVLPGTKPYAIAVPMEVVTKLITPASSPESAAEVPSSSASADSTIATPVAYYTVRANDTLSKIAKQHHCSVAQLKQWNALQSDIIRVGQKLRVN